ncbi:MAG: hypothetical protein WC869_02685 [Phycisphaerae bacterium]
MNREQKMAWLIVGAFALALTGFLTLLLFVGPKGATGAFGLCGLAGLGPILFRRTSADIVSADERDVDIARRATVGGGMLSYLTFVLTSFVPWYILYHRGQTTVSIEILPLITFSGFIVLFVSRAIILLVLYGRGEREQHVR